MAYRQLESSPAKRDSCETKPAGTAMPEVTAWSIPRRKSGEAAPPSFAQQRLWFLDRWHPGSALYNVPAAFRVKGPLDTDILVRSLNEVLDRHEALRTTFVGYNGQLVQRVCQETAWKPEMADLSHLPASERAAEAIRCAAQEARRPFDLANGPLFRTSILRIDEQEHVLVFVIHHIVTDGWSMGVLFHELNVLYEAFAAEKPSPLPELPIQYADYAAWQRRWLQGKTLEREIEYWRQRLEGLETLELYTDRPRPSRMSYSGAIEEILLPRDLLAKLKDFSVREGVTLFMTLLSAFQTLLHRYSGQDDIVVGSPIANRNLLEVEGLIGFFVNTLVLRTDMGRDPGFRELLGRVKEAALEAYAHQDLPFERLVEEINPERDPTRNPLFQVLFVLQNNEDPVLRFPGLEVEPLPVRTDTAKFDLLLEMTEEAGTLKGSFEYSTDLFDGSTIGRMVAHFRTLLEGIAADPDQKLSELPLMTPQERHRILVECRGARTDYRTDVCIHQLFEEQAARTPEEIAAVFDDQHLTYRELDVRANRLAHYLRKRGVGPDMPVGLCVERSLDMLTGLLGILKAGGAYLPLDPAYPKERLNFMLEDAGAKVLVTRERLQELWGVVPPERIFLNPDWEIFSGEPESAPEKWTSPENLAYVLYTSGSTGIPKGVAMPHRPLCNLISWQIGRGRTGKARCLQFAPLSFDVSFQEIFSTWCSGGTLVLVPEEVRRDPDALVNLLRAQSVERLFLPSAALQQIAQAAGKDGRTPGTLREVIVAGEQLQITAPIAEWFGRMPQCVLENQYGPTESHVVSAFTLESSPGQWPALPPIGRPIANTRLYILDRHRRPVPIGLAGELYIGGDCLAREYLNRPELTAERFIPDPFGDTPGARLYRTGDMARYLPDGNIEFLGRMDDQVKIRGFRIEPGEIETVLMRHPAVRQAAVAVREGAPGDRRLAAYVVCGADVGADALRRFLKARLPEHMIPSAYVFLESLPQTPGGKVDRRALPAPDRVRPEMEQSYIAPRTPVEEELAGIWAELLGVERVGIRDNFFDLGGHSLLAVQMLSKVGERLNRKLPLSDLFQSPTIEGIAAVVEQELISGALSPIVGIRRTGGKCPLFVLHDLGGETILAHRLADCLGPDQPIYAFYHGSGAIRDREKRLEDLAAYYVENLVAFQSRGPYCLVGYSFGGYLAYEMARQLALLGHRIGHLAIIDAGFSFPGRLTLKSGLSDAGNFLRNAPWWVWDVLLGTPPAEMGRRLQRLGRRAGKRLKQIIRPGMGGDAAPDLKDILTLRDLPEDYVRMMEYHFELLQKYRPRPYAGPLALYRARTQTLLSARKPDLGWRDFVSGRIETVRLPGNHHDVVLEPRIRVFAAALGAAMETISRQARSDHPADGIS